MTGTFLLLAIASYRMVNVKWGIGLGRQRDDRGRRLMAARFRRKEQTIDTHHDKLIRDYPLEAQGS